MINISLLRQLLNPEQIKVLEEVLSQREDTILGYKILQKQYSNTKRNIKAIEKKLIRELQNLPEDSFFPRRIEAEIAAIENKYPAVDKAIKNYKQAMQYFNRCLSDPYFRLFNPQNQWDRSIQNLRSYLGTANICIDGG